jgi:hypothetical protein
MPNKLLQGITVCAFLCAGSLFVYTLLQSDTQREASTEETSSLHEGTPGHAVSQEKLRAMETSQDYGRVVMDDETGEIDLQIAEVIQSYDEISKYPPYSQPILSEEHINAFVNASKPDSSLPFPFPDLPQAIQLSISLEEYNYFYGDTIRAQIKVNDIPENASVSVRTKVMSLEGEVLAEGVPEIVSESAMAVQIESSFDTLTYNTDAWPLEMNAAATVEVDGRLMFISAPFRINKQTAMVSGLGFSEPKKENLEIPVNLEVSLPGYYYVAGILYGGESGKPLVHLEAEGPLADGSDTLTLKAHIQALKKGGDEGPYELRNVRVERWSDEILPLDVAGKVSNDTLLVEGYQFEDFDDQPYIDPLHKERMQIMQGLSSL